MIVYLIVHKTAKVVSLFSEYDCEVTDKDACAHFKYYEGETYDNDFKIPTATGTT